MAFDESAWVAVGFVIFIALVWRKAGSAIGGMLDGRANAIRDELAQAKALRDDAAAQLETYKTQQAQAEKDAKTMLANAKAAAERIRADAAAKAEDNIKRREAQATAKIAAAEAAVISELRSKAATIATMAAREIITEKLDADGAMALVEGAIGQMSQK